MTHKDYPLVPHTDFEDFDFEGRSLTGLDLSHCNFERANVDGVDFSEANLEGAKFSRTNLCNCTFNGANLDGADLSMASIGNTDFKGASLRGANLSYIKGDCPVGDDEYVDEHLAMYPHLSPVHGSRGGYSFDDADFTGALLVKAGLNGGTFCRADFTDACLTGAELIETDFSESVLDRARFDKAYFCHSKIIDAKGRSVDFSEADLTMTSLSLSDLPNARFVGACLRGASLAFCFLAGADFRLAYCRGLESDLYANEYISIHPTDFDGSKRNGANFQWAEIDECNFDDES